MAKKHKSRGSAEAEKSPHMRLSFWLNPANQHWNKPIYPDWYRDHCQKWLEKWASETRNIATLDPNLK